MLKNLSFILLRSFKKYWIHSILNIITLSVGIACSILIVQYVLHELSYDKHYKNSEDIVRVTSEWFQNNEFMEHRAAAVPGLVQLLKTYPEVKKIARYHKGATNVVRNLDTDVRFIENSIFYSDTEFAEIFDLNLSAGSLQQFNEPNKVLVSRTIALKYFNNQNPIGKTLNFDGEFSFNAEIIGVFEDFETNTHLAGDFILSLKTKEQLVAFNIPDNWIWRSFHTYIELEPGSDLNTIEKRINTYVSNEKKAYYDRGNYKVTFYVQALHDIHMSEALFEEIRPSGNANSLKILIVSGAFLLLIGIFNFVNLATARNLRRGKEVAIRKVCGAPFSALAFQYLLESILFVGLSTIIALVSIGITYPLIGNYLGFAFNFTLFSNPIFWFLLVGVVLFVGILAGIYPAVILSSASLTLLFRARGIDSQGSNFLRKVLVAFQFALSLGLILCVVVILEQTEYMRDRDLGIRRENILVVEGPKIKTENYYAQLDLFKRSIKRIGSIGNVSTVSTLPGEVTGAGRDFISNKGERQFLKIVRVDYDFEKVLGLDIIKGRSFSQARHPDDSSLVLNEAAFKLFEFESFEEAQFTQGLSWQNIGELTNSPIIGITKDYYPDAQSNAVPTAFVLNRVHNAPWDPEYYVVHMVTKNVDEINNSIKIMEESWDEFFPNDPIVAYFADDYYNNQFKGEVRLAKLIKTFSSIALLLATIGLIAMVSYTNLSRLKEISIRKVLGASEVRIHKLLLISNTKPVVLCAIVVTPIFYWLLNNWLNSYSYRIEIGWFLVAGVVSIYILFIAVVVILQSIKTVGVNPAKTLKEQ